MTKWVNKWMTTTTTTKTTKVENYIYIYIYTSLIIIQTAACHI